MLTHDDILQALEAEYSDEVFLVARLNDPTLGMDDDTQPHVFIPDCHVVPKHDAIRFPHVTADEGQVAALERFLSLMKALRAQDPSLTVWQLGDFIDLWRVGGLGGEVDDDMALVESDRASLIGHLQDLDMLGALPRMLVGNHDAELGGFRWRLPREVVAPRRGAGGETRLVHGHQFDPIETLPDDIKEFFARGATERIPPVALGMLEATNPHWQPRTPTDPPPRPPKNDLGYLRAGLETDRVPLNRDAINVRAYVKVSTPPADAFLNNLGAPGAKTSLDPPGQTFFTDAAWWADQYAKTGRDLRLIVIGHTHKARIVRGTRADGTRLVLLDCGAWVGPGFLSKKLNRPIFNAQIGVKAGNEVRIYQVGRRML